MSVMLVPRIVREVPIIAPAAHSTHRDQSVHAIVITGTTAW